MNNISVESLQESGQVESKVHLTYDVTRLDDVISVVPQLEIFPSSFGLGEYFQLRGNNFQ